MWAHISMHIVHLEVKGHRHMLRLLSDVRYLGVNRFLLRSLG